MTTVLVTGSAGFIGSHIVDACLDRGDRVIGVDVMTDYYDVGQKRSNIEGARSDDRFEYLEVDINDMPLDLLDGVDVIFHQAGQPGVRSSWRDQFDEYVHRNVSATQRLLEAAVQRGVERFVYASSSSLYGNAERYPVDESMRPQPFSPYGVTKLAAEHLCSLYGGNFGLSTVSLRYFTVYGPRQRPDMATHRLFEAALNGTPFPLFGTGDQLRDFTYVGDVVRANLLAGEADVEPGLVVNIAGGGQSSMHDLIAEVEAVSGRTIQIDRLDPERGDVGRTGALTDRARELLRWEPQVALREGLERQYEWHLLRR
ncbi:MAG: NAD-dependent epimerase/dehydratase family protein [Ilumatobacteraceae bacterium]|nr:NAD-dependent epimerase/dehydratase family protein [Ilumatobacteraceae bacterium]